MGLAHLCPAVSNSGTAPPLRPTEIASGSPSAGAALGATTLYWMLSGFKSGFAPGLLVPSSGSSGSDGSSSSSKHEQAGVDACGWLLPHCLPAAKTSTGRWGLSLLSTCWPIDCHCWSAPAAVWCCTQLLGCAPSPLHDELGHLISRCALGFNLDVQSAGRLRRYFDLQLPETAAVLW